MRESTSRATRSRRSTAPRSIPSPAAQRDAAGTSPRASSASAPASAFPSTRSDSGEGVSSPPRIRPLKTTSAISSARPSTRLTRNCTSESAKSSDSGRIGISRTVARCGVAFVVAMSSQLGGREHFGEQVGVDERPVPDGLPRHVAGDRRAAGAKRGAGERRVARPHLHGSLERNARVALRREPQPRRELARAGRGEVDNDLGARGIRRLGKRARQAGAHASARAVEAERRAPFAQDPLDRAGAERPGERLAAQAAAQLCRDRPAARLNHLSRVEPHRHRPCAREVAVREDGTVDGDSPVEVARELAQAVAACIERDLDPPHAAGDVGRVEHQLGEPAEGRLARAEVRAQAWRRARAVGGELALETRTGNRCRERCGELARVDAKARAEFAHVARHTHPARDAQLKVGVEQGQPLQIEARPFERLEGRGNRLGFLGRGTRRAVKERARIELGDSKAATELRARAARIEGELARDRGAPDYAVERLQRDAARCDVELAGDRGAERRRLDGQEPSGLAQVSGAGTESDPHGGPIQRPAQRPAAIDHRPRQEDLELERPGLRCTEPRQRCAARPCRERARSVRASAHFDPDGLTGGRFGAELGELEAAGRPPARLLDQQVLENDAVNVEPPTRGGSVLRATDEGPVRASIARPGEPHDDVAAPDLAHPDLVLQQRQKLHRHVELADAREVGRLEARRVCDPDAVDPQGGTEREGQPRGPVEAHLPAEGARQRGRDRFAPALRVDTDPDRRDRS